MFGRSSFGFLGRFGRSADLKAFDEGLRLCDVHPAQVVDGVKLAAVRVVQRHDSRPSLPDESYVRAAALVAFCIKGEVGLATAIGEVAAGDLARRLELALDCPESMDAELVLLALHARLVAPAVVERYDLSIDEA